MTAPTSVEELRERAQALADDDKIAFRSCWNCNPAHEHLRTVEDLVILCFACGHYFVLGQQVSE